MREGRHTPSQGVHRAKALILAVLIGVGGSACRADDLPCATPTEVLRITAVIGELELETSDGRRLRLAGLDVARATPADPALGEDARRRLALRLVGHDVAVAFLSPSADRWERFDVLAFAAAEATGAALPIAAETLSINESLIAEGWARAKADPVLPSCFAAWLGREDQARRSGLGLWADPYYAVVDADDRKGLAERSGAMALVDGRLSLRESRGRLRIRLGDSGGLMANVTRGGAKSLARAGLDTHGLAGARLRLRGYIDDRFGPRIDVTDARQVEVLDRTGAGKAEPRGTSSGTVAPLGGGELGDP